MIHKMIDTTGKVSIMTHYVDAEDVHHVVSDYILYTSIL